jgi:hypothetical protein
MGYLDLDLAALKHLGHSVLKVFYHLSSTDSISMPIKPPYAFHEGLCDQWRKMDANPGERGVRIEKLG